MILSKIQAQSIRNQLKGQICACFFAIYLFLVLMNSLQILQSKPAKIILDRTVHSSASAALIELNWKTLEVRRF